jgi:septum site-determining protein MinC
MDSSPLTSLSDPESIEPLELHHTEETSTPLIERYVQVHLKTEGDQLHLILPKSQPTATGNDWAQICSGLKYRLKNHEKTWTSQTPVFVISQDRLLDARQLQNLSEILQEADLILKWVHTSRRQTAVAAVTAGYSVEQIYTTPTLFSEPNVIKHSPLADPLYLKTTVRSGVEIKHPGSIIIVGDVNPGGDVIADGDIIIWGTLRGVAHAGAKGNTNSRIMALRMEPTQLRIAEQIARSPSSSPNHYEPEIAYISPEGIRITQAYNFSKTSLMNLIRGTSEK